MSTPSTSDKLRSVVQKFLIGFVNGSEPKELLDQTYRPDAEIHEHGPVWAAKDLSFLSQTFKHRRSTADGNTTCDDYFERLGSTLSFHPHENTLPEPSRYVVDPSNKVKDNDGAGVVMVRAHAGLDSITTKQSWEEEFIFVFSNFSSDGKIGRMEIWADNLCAWSAVNGKLSG